MKKAFITLLILSLGFNHPLAIYAQTATDSDLPAVEATDSPALDLIANSLPDNPIPDSLLDQDTLPSATFRLPMFVASLIKNSFQAKEKVDVVVRNANEQEVQNLDIQIENTTGGKANVLVEKNYVNSQLVFSINPEAGFRPGKYKVKVIDTANNQVLSEQDFTWGVLAINTNKSIYSDGERASIAIAVLDEGGRMVCDANVELQIISPLGVETKLSTADGSIIVNKECLLHEVTEKPDYETSYITSGVGRYITTLTAATANGSYTIKDRFEVREYVPFDVERVTATRIYPPETYPVEIKIKANEAFRGKIVETVPQDFQISPGKEGTVSYQEESIVSESFNPRKEYNILDLPLPFKDNYPVTLGFGQPLYDSSQIDVYKKSGLDGHDGIDFALPRGTPVLSVDAGKVILAKENWIYGHTVVIEHSWGRSYYGHLSEIKINEGSFVSQGSEIGISGSTGLSTGPHLHFGLKPKINDIDNLYFGKIDPAPFFGLANEDPTLSTADYPIAAKALVWNIDVEAGSEFTIGYQYKAPNKSPYFYTIGPLQFITSDIKAVEPAKFDVQLNPFVLGTATESGKLAITENTELSAESTEQQQSSHEAIEPFSSDAVVFSEIRQWQIAVDTTRKIEQQINIIDQVYSTTTSGAPTDNSLGIVQFDPSKYNAESLYFEVITKNDSGTYGRSRTSFSVPASAKQYTVVIKAQDEVCAPNPLGDPWAYLYNITDANIAASIQLGTTCSNVSTVYIKAARLIIVQSADPQITDTQTQVEVGNNETSTGTTYADLTDKKIYRYTSGSWDPAPTINFEASLKAPSGEGTPTDTGPNNPATGAQDTTVGGTAWDTYTNSFSDNATYDSVSLAKGKISYYNKATNFGFSGIPTDATIKGIKVEINGYVNNVLMDDSSVKIVKGGTVTGTDQASATDWPTSDTGAYRTYGGTTNLWGTTWSPSDINSASGFGVAFAFVNNKTGSPATYTGNIDHIRITVTYAPAVAQTTYAALYDTGGTLVTGSEVSTTSTSWTRVITASSITLTDATDYVVRVKTSSGGTANIANAKIILDQTAAGGIDKLEPVHQYINTKVTCSGCSYTLQDFDNEYNPSNWAGGTFNYYFESTMNSLSASGVTSRLYNVSDSDAIDTPTTSEVGTISGSYVRQRSADLSANSDWPSAAKTLDTQIDGSAPETINASTSWLIIQVTGLTSAGPSGPTLDQLMRHGKWFDGGVEQPFTF